MAVVRVRQHVNPLSQKYQQPVEPPDWSKIYANRNCPLHLDIGCGRGYFLLSMAQLCLDWNFLGLEIREPLVTQANQWGDELGLTNLHYLFCNVGNSLQPLLASFPPRSLHRVTIQFPDPWFKKRHQKRRMVQPALVETIAQFLIPEGIVFIQSDVEEMAAEMCSYFEGHSAFYRSSSAWLPDNPLPVATEREKSTLLRGEAVYRAVFIHK